jgi:hypothetical protein
MGEGDKRSDDHKLGNRPEHRLGRAHHETRDPARASEKRGDHPGPRPEPADAAGTPKPADLPLRSRTATVDDPFTTSLLAEVARRTRTIDVSPEQIAEAMDAAPADPDSPDDLFLQPFRPAVPRAPRAVTVPAKAPPAAPASASGAPSGAHSGERPARRR